MIRSGNFNREYLQLLAAAMPKGRDMLAPTVAAAGGLAIISLGNLSLSVLTDGHALASHLLLWTATVAWLHVFRPAFVRERFGENLGLAAITGWLFFLAAVLVQTFSPPSIAPGLTEPSFLAALALTVPALIATNQLYRSPEEGAHAAARLRQEEALSIVFHELRRPLSVLISASELALESDMPPADRTRMIETVHQQALRLNDFLEEIVETTRIQAGRLRLNPRPTDVRALVLETVSEFAETHPETEVRHRLGKRPIMAMADRGKLKVVLMNLLANASAYSPRGSTVTVGAKREGDSVTLHVDDEGHGIPQPYRNQIFEPFFRIPGTTERGFGLGLYIARQLLLAQRGSIKVQGRSPRGARFLMELPAMKTVVVPLIPSGRGESAPTLRFRRQARPGRKPQVSTRDKRAPRRETTS